MYPLTTNGREVAKLSWKQFQPTNDSGCHCLRAKTMEPPNGREGEVQLTVILMPGSLFSSPSLLPRFCFRLPPLLGSFSLKTTHHLLHLLIVRPILRLPPFLHHPREEAVVLPQLPHCTFLLLPVLCTQPLSGRSLRVRVLRAEVRGRRA
jgi:hypothetical protein